MKKTLIYLFLFVNIWATKAEYHPMLNNPKWIIRVYPFIGPEPYFDIISGGNEVTIGSFTYLKIYDPVYQQDLYFREDVNTKKVFQYLEGNDVVVFDFSLEVSDTITFENGITYTVTSVSEISVNDGTRKTILLNSVLGSEYWVEGIGSLGHPLISHIVLSEPTVTLSCNFQNDINIYSALNVDCENLLKINTNNKISSDIKLFPNPLTIETTIELKEHLKNGSVKIFNSVGQLVMELKNKNGRRIIVNRGNLTDGVYNLQLFDSNVLVANRKIVIQSQ
ncbi:T9SS type A sorting domain-containing protein [Flavobacterium caeni]|uniref:Por secretion system C-terminal sorting domain-containing protein n=1 Tax=Flavobacterium caeni TaxID=490189 RepID=A0A1G5KJ08_9FLAO|nr:T9SS type A sorting domain-containing protein [Flavobacterium caeni]SCZ00615.1 Por secretion system C-terminal sorting domain-containing protein [Flavobacterium caeni]